jgi:hypothetical protein
MSLRPAWATQTLSPKTISMRTYVLPQPLSYTPVLYAFVIFEKESCVFAQAGFELRSS